MTSLTTQTLPVQGLQGISYVKIYNGDGTDSTSTDSLYSIFKKSLPKATVKFIPANEFNPKSWDKKKTLLVMPGGSCSIWDNDIGSKINDIRGFVLGGGRYYGVCAGAYYASKHIFYGNKKKSRNLCLYPGTSKGPLLDSQTIPSQSPLELISVKTTTFTSTTDVAINGGGYFETEKKQACEAILLAKYVIQNQKRLPAVVKCHVGLGSAILSHVHWEYTLPTDVTSLTALKKQFPEINWKKQAKTLLQNKEERLSVFKRLLSEF